MYFTLSQFQLFMMALLGGLLLVLVIVIGYWSYRLSFTRRREEPAVDDSEVAQPEGPVEGALEGHRPIPLAIILLTAVILVWGVAYVIVVALGGLNVQ